MKPDSARTILSAAVACAILAGSCAPRAGGRAPDAIGISVPWEIATLDPHASGSAGSLSVAANFYEPLVAMSPALRLEPALASAWENPDPLTWIFHLRPGVRFHSGKRLSASDVVYSLERLRAGTDLELAIYAQDVEEARALDPATVRIRTRMPVTILLSRLQYVFIVPEGSTADDLSRREDGTGPYRLAGWDPGSRITMAAFDRYWGPRPALSRVTFRLLRTADEAIGDLAARRSQLILCESGRVEEVASRLAGVAVERRSSLFVRYLAFDLSREAALFCSARPNPFRSAAVRRAVDLAIDRSRLAPRLGATHPAAQLVPPTVFGFDPSLVPPPHDPAEARRLLSEAGYPGGFRVVLHTRRIFADTAQRVKEMLADAGIDVDVAILTDRDFWTALADGRPTAVLDRFACQTGDASEILAEVIHSRDPSRRLGEYNFGGWSDLALDREIEKSDAESTGAARSEILRRILNRVAAEHRIVPLDVEEGAYAIRKEYAWTPREDGDIRAAEIAPAPPATPTAQR